MVDQGLEEVDVDDEQAHPEARRCVNRAGD